MLLKNFLTSESGAVTVDWVILTASCVGLCLTILFAISGGTSQVASNLSTYMESDDAFVNTTVEQSGAAAEEEPAAPQETTSF